jgi:RNA polymerase sigma-70 factor (ECF subfamily)
MSLLARLKDSQDQDSWREFFDMYWRLIYAVAIQAGLTDAEAQDVVQETVISVSKSIHKFRCDRSFGSFKAWLLRLTRWRISDQFRNRLVNCALPEDHRLRFSRRGSALAEELGSKETATSSALDYSVDPSSVILDQVWDEEWKNNLLATAIERVKAQVRPKDYQIFDLCVIKSLPISRVASTLGVSAAQVYLAKHRITKLIREKVRRLEPRDAATDRK